MSYQSQFKRKKRKKREISTNTNCEQGTRLYIVDIRFVTKPKIRHKYYGILANIHVKYHTIVLESSSLFIL